MKRIIPIFLGLALILCGCQNTGGQTEAGGTSANGSDTSTAAPAEVDFAQTDSDMFSDRDYEVGYDESTAVRIELNGDSAVSSSNSVQISGSTVTITEEATYVISGTLDDGMIVVDADETAKLQLVFDGVDINSETTAPLYILEGDKVFVTLAADAENSLSNGGSFSAIDENNIDAVIFSKQDLTLNGSGSLTVTSPAGHGIVSKDDLVITSGTYTVNSASHGLDANDSVRIANASVTVDAGKDGIHAENSDDTSLGFVYIASGTFNIAAEGDGISAGAHMQIDDGTFDIISGGGSVNAEKQTSDSWGGFMGGGRPGQGMMPTSATTETTEDSGTSIKGIKSTGSMLISGGTFTIDSADDSVHSNASITVNGGTFGIASGDDGFHADETLTVTAGTLNITESYEGLEALHIAVSGGDISLVSSDDGLNAAGGTDQSGFGGTRGNEQFGGGKGGMGGGPGGMAPGGQGGMGQMGTSASGGSIVISGGNLHVNASGDGIDANGTLEISGGYTVVVGPTQGDTATLDYDTSAVIKGGTFIGTGASGMAQTFSDSEQGLISVSVGNQSAGTKITLTDKDGNEIISYEPELSFAVVILSSPDMVSGESYTVTVGDASEEFEAR